MRTAAGAFIEVAGRVLLVQPNYKPYWDLPGGIVEEGESPRDAVLRECKEELGVLVHIGRLLVVDHVSAEQGLRFVFQARLPHGVPVVLQDSELSSFAWCSPSKRAERLAKAPMLGRRVSAARLAVQTGATFYLEAAQAFGVQL